MPLTEEEARTKWCPMARVFAVADKPVTVSITAINRDYDGNLIVAARCIAPDCMLWTWDGCFYRKDGEVRTGRCGLGRV